MISKISVGFLISQILFCDITNSILWYHKIITIFWYHQIKFVMSQNRFGVLVLKKMIDSAIFIRMCAWEKIIAWAFTARINGTQIAIWASTWDLGIVAKAQAVQMWLASAFAARTRGTQIAIWASTCDFGTYRIIVCRLLRRACAIIQTRQSLRTQIASSLLHCRVPKAQASLCKYAASSEPSLLGKLHFS